MSDNVFEFKRQYPKYNRRDDPNDTVAIANAKLNPIVNKLKESLVAEFGNDVAFALVIHRNNVPESDPTSRLSATNLSSVSDLYHLLNTSAGSVYEYTSAQLAEALAIISSNNIKPTE